MIQDNSLLSQDAIRSCGDWCFRLLPSVRAGRTGPPAHGRDLVKFRQRRRLRGDLQRGEGSRTVSAGFQPGASGQPADDDDHISQRSLRHHGGPARTGMAFHGGQHQQQVKDLAAVTGRADGAAQVISRADRAGHRHR